MAVNNRDVGFMRADAEEIMKRIQMNSGVIGVSVVDCNGITIRSSMTNEVASQYAYLANVVTQKARKMINDFDSHNSISLLRIRTKKNEIIIAPDVEYTMIVVQSPDVTADAF